MFELGASHTRRFQSSTPRTRNGQLGWQRVLLLRFWGHMAYAVPYAFTKSYKGTCMPTQTQAIKPTFSQIGHEFDGPREFIAKKKGVWDLVAISRWGQRKFHLNVPLLSEVVRWLKVRTDIFAVFLVQSLCHEVEVQTGLLMFLMFLVKQWRWNLCSQDGSDIANITCKSWENQEILTRTLRPQVKQLWPPTLWPLSRTGFVTWRPRATAQQKKAIKE